MWGIVKIWTRSLIHRPIFHSNSSCFSIFPYFTSIPNLSWPTLSLDGSTVTLNQPQISSLPYLHDLIGYIWLAVPKRKVTPGKKRMKTTLQNRIKTKSHVIVDRRTGELTLRHRLPWNWKDYLPENVQGKSKQE
jgi:ribosomal protein L32